MGARDRKTKSSCQLKWFYAKLTNELSSLVFCYKIGYRIGQIFCVQSGFLNFWPGTHRKNLNPYTEEYDARKHYKPNEWMIHSFLLLSPFLLRLHLDSIWFHLNCGLDTLCEFLISFDLSPPSRPLTLRGCLFLYSIHCCVHTPNATKKHFDLSALMLRGSISAVDIFRSNVIV